MTPLWVRLWHWVAAAAFLMLLFTGAVMTYSGADFALMNYALAHKLHQWAGVGFSVLVVAYPVAAMATGYWERYQRRWNGLRSRIRQQATSVLNRRPAPQPEAGPRAEALRNMLFYIQHFLSVASVVILSPLLAVTGVMLLFPELVPEKAAGFAGLWVVAQTHSWAGLMGALFLLFHVYIATMGGLRRMIRGR